MLLASSFGLFRDDYVSVSFNVGSNLKQVSLTQIPGTSSIDWPNEARVVPQGALNGGVTAISICGGFLVPTKTTGAVNLVPFSSSGWGTPVQISTDKSGYFYHRLRWLDMDGDGDLDVLTARATSPVFGTAGGELLWLEQPKNPLTDPWTEHVLLPGPDVMFEVVYLNNSTVPQIIACQFFTKLVTLVYTQDGSWKPSSLQTVVIDSTIDKAFDLRVVDVNGDSILDLVVTNHETDPTKAGVFAYEIPTNYRTPNWKKHTLASGFILKDTSSGAGTPGAAFEFLPKTGMKSRPFFALAGDGSYQAYVLVPQGPTGWQYTTNVLLDSGGTIGQLTVHDINNDGYAEIFVPDYNHGVGYVFSYGQ